MKIETLQAGTRVGIDANIFIYHFSGTSTQCTDFLRRCEVLELKGFLPMTVLAETFHRLMLLEALAKQLVHGVNPTRRLRERPDIVRNLTDYAANGDAILQMGLELVAPSKQTVRLSQSLRDRHGLLVNDSLTAALLEEHGVAHLATADRDFERVPGLTVWTPTDFT